MIRHYARRLLLSYLPRLGVYQVAQFSGLSKNYG